MKILITLFVLVLSVHSFAQAKYVDGTNGNDNNDGNSTSSAWQTIQKAMDEATAGTTVFIRGGNYHETDLQLNVSGTSGAEIVFRNYQGETPVITGNNLQGTLLYIENQSYFEIYGLTFANLIGNNSVAVEITGDSHHFTFRKNEIHDISWTANISTLPTSTDNANGFVVYGNTASGVHDFIVDSCEIHHNTTGFSENLTLDGNVFNFEVIANEVHDNSNIGIVCAGNYGVIADPNLDQTRDGIVRDNVCYNNTSNYATSAGIYVDGGKNIDVFRNLCYGNGFGIEVGAEENGTTTDIRVYDNLVFDNKEAGIAIGGYDIGTTGQVTQSVVRNNTLYNNGISGNSLGELYITKLSDSFIENNIIVAGSNGKLLTREVISPQGDNFFLFNLWYSEGNIDADIDGMNYTDYSSINTALGQVTSVYGNPEFENTTSGSYQLNVLVSSPAIDAGNPEFTFYQNETDFGKNPRLAGTAIDIGAYEWNVISVNESLDNQFIMFPNPAAEDVTITSNFSGTLLLRDAQQKAIFIGEIMNNRTIDLSDLSAGVYFITLCNDKQNSTQILIKQ